MNGSRRRSTPATTVLLALNLFAFGLDFLGVPLNEKFFNYGPYVRDGQVWRLLTAMFLHAGPLHIAVNMISLYQLGRFYELMFGTRRFLWIYFITGLIGSLASAFYTDAASVGASGAIFGIMGAFIFSIRRSPRWRNDPFGRSIVAQGVFLIIANLIITWTVPHIDKAGHVGGLVAGLLLGALLPHEPAPPTPPSQVVVEVVPTPDATPAADPEARRDDR